PVGEKLPSETRLVREFGAGRSTVVRALQILSMQGWIEREHGRGSFVKGVPHQAVERSRAGASAFEAPENSKSDRIVRAGRMSIPATVAAGIGLPEHAPAIMRRRLVLDAGEPCDVGAPWFPLK